MKDVDELELGMLLDIITTSNNIYEDNEGNVRKATQADFDRF